MYRGPYRLFNAIYLYIQIIIGLSSLFPKEIGLGRSYIYNSVIKFREYPYIARSLSITKPN